MNKVLFRKIKISAILFTIMLSLVNLQEVKADAVLPTLPTQSHNYDVSIAAGASTATI